MVNPFEKLRKISEERKARKEMEKRLAEKKARTEKEIDKLEMDLKIGLRSFPHVIEFEQRKINILSSIKDLWQKNWEKAEYFIKKSVPKLINEQLKVLGEDIRLAEENEKLVVRLLTEGNLGNHRTWDIRTRQLFSELAKTDKTLEKDVILIFRPIRAFYINLGKNLRKQLNFFESEKVWDLISQSRGYLREIEAEKEQMQRFMDFYQEKYDDIIYRIKMEKALMMDFNDPKIIKDFLEGVKEKCGFNLYGVEGGYRTIYKKNIPIETQGFIEQFVPLPISFLAGTIYNSNPGSSATNYTSLNCKEAVFNLVYYAPTKKLLEKGDDERPAVLIFYGVSDPGSRRESIVATLILGLEDALKLMHYFEKNPSKIYDFFRTFHDRLNHQNITRNGRVLFLTPNLNYITVKLRDDTRHVFNDKVNDEMLKKFLLTY